MRRHVVMVGLLVGAVAGCASAPAGGPLFNNEDAKNISCMTHQADGPGARYTDTEQRNTAEVLTFMRYYTANGTKPYCDNAPAQDTDKAWGRLYVDFEGSPDKVTTVLR